VRGEFPAKIGSEVIAEGEGLLEEGLESEVGGGRREEEEEEEEEH